MVTRRYGMVQKRNITVDTNVVQSLYRLMGNGGDSDVIMANYSLEQVNSLKKLIKNLCDYTIHITPQVEKELKKCEEKYAGIMEFARTVLGIPKAKEYKAGSFIDEHIRALQQEYLREDIHINDSTRKLQSALTSETKNGEVDTADSLIIAENSVLYGYPFFTLNEKHLISMRETEDKRKAYRSRAILDKNRRYLKQVPHKHSVVRKNLKAQHATTYRIVRVFDKELYM